MSEKNKLENHPPKILLIDDDEEFTDDLIFLLDGPYQIVAVHESNKAIELLEKEEFDLVMLDIEMPAFYADDDEREGIEVLKLIQKNLSIKVFVITKLDTTEIKRICRKLEADEILIKPFDIAILKKKINELVRCL
jgi:CheY-like chemotaxis protein